MGFVSLLSATSQSGFSTWPLIAVAAGVLTVLGLMIFLHCNAFIALLAAALVVAVLGGIGGADPMTEVVNALGSTAGSIAVVIAMAAIIGKCMLDSGAADTIVNAAVRVTGEKKAPIGLLGSGFVLAIPVFFDTVFYLLVPLARSLYHKTKKHYLLYVMAIACGGAITHTLVPPTPGPLLVAATLGADVGSVMVVGVMVALPSAIVGLMFCIFADKWIVIPERPLAGVKADSPENDAEDAANQGKPPREMPLWLALAPVLLPVLMITASTVATTIADKEDRARLASSDLADPTALVAAIRQEASESPESPGARILASRKLDADQRKLLVEGDELEPQAVADALNRALLDPALYTPDAFRQVKLDEKLRAQLTADQLRTKPVDMRRLNRRLLEATYPNYVGPHEWNSPSRQLSNKLTGIGNANVALSLAAMISIATLAWAKRRSLKALAGDVEESLMSGGLIILITAAGGAFGKMLQSAGITGAIQAMVDVQGSGLMVMVLGFGIAALLKVAQGSSTVAMIIGSSMVMAMVNVESLDYHTAYLVTAIGGGSLIGSWMNDSGFWVYAKMGGLTEGESLKTWTPLLIILGTSALVFSMLFSLVLPLK